MWIYIYMSEGLQTRNFRPKQTVYWFFNEWQVFQCLTTNNLKKKYTKNIILKNTAWHIPYL